MQKKNNLSCTNCLMPHNFPNIRFEGKICSLCKEFNLVDFQERQRKSFLKLKNYLSKISKKKIKYHLVLALSGGKDSSYLAFYLKKNFNLRVFAITVDNGFISKQALVNCKLVCDQLNINHEIVKPKKKYFNNVYKKSILEKKNLSEIRRSSDICSGCISHVNSIAMKVAIKKNIPIIAGGYIAGQVPSGESMLDYSKEKIVFFSKVKKIDSKYKPTPNEIKNFKFSEGLKIIHPFLSIDYSEKKILNFLSNLGWKKPRDTGDNSSNCKINDLGIKLHLEKYNLHPYQLEISDQLRKKKITHEIAKRKLNSKIDTKSTNLIYNEIIK